MNMPLRKNCQNEGNEASVNDIGLVSNRNSMFNSGNQTGKVIKVFDANGNQNGTMVTSAVARENVN